MTTEQQQAALGQLAVWVGTAQELTTKAHGLAFADDMLPLTDEYRGYISRAAFYLTEAAGLLQAQLQAQTAQGVTNG